MENLEKDPIKEAFSKVKQDIINLKSELFEIKNLLISVQDSLNTQKLHEITSNNKLIPSLNQQTDNSTQSPTLRQQNQTYSAYSTQNTTHYSTVPQEIGGLKYPNLTISTGNEGASTDRQTDQQTDNSTHISTDFTHNPQNIEKKPHTIESNIQKASEILDSLDNLKKEIRIKFKKITPQEMSVFSTIYQLEEQDITEPTYKKIAKNLKLSESSIRDYVQRMINKGIPLKKQKINNKQIVLSISPNLKKIATLSTIIQLRGL